MNCPRCYVNLPVNSVACYRCGTQILSPFFQPPQVSTSPRKPQTYSPAVMVLVVIAFVGGIIGIFIGFWVFLSNFNSRESTFNKSSQYAVNNFQKMPSPIPESERKKEVESVATVETEIVNEMFEVPAASYKYFSFTLNTTANVSGKFEASGGSNDIDCLLVDEDEFINFENGNAFRVFYQSNYTTRGKFNKRLSAGTYYLIFNNSKAMVTNKIVTAEIYAK